MRFFLLENELEELIQMGLYARFVVVSVGQVAPEVLHAVRDHGIVVSHRRVADNAVGLAGCEEEEPRSEALLELHFGILHLAGMRR